MIPRRATHRRVRAAPFQRPPTTDPSLPEGTYREPDEGGAAAYRSRLARRAGRRWLVVSLAVGVAAAAGIAFVLYHPSAAPGTTSSGPGSGGSGGTGGGGSGGSISIALGSPAVATVACGSGGNASSEAIAWRSSSTPITLADLNLYVVEIGDGDILRATASAPEVTPTDPCAGSAPSPAYAWYAVLSDPTGANVAYFTLSVGWVPLGGPPAQAIAAGSTITVLIDPSVADTGYGLEVQGFVNGVPFAAGTPL